MEDLSNPRRIEKPRLECATMGNTPLPIVSSYDNSHDNNRTAFPLLLRLYLLFHYSTMTISGVLSTLLRIVIAYTNIIILSPLLLLLLLYLLTTTLLKK